MKNYKLSLLDSFNSMRVFLNVRYDKTNSDKLGTLCGSLNLWKRRSDWKENPQTFDPSAWKDWLGGVTKTLKEIKNLEKDPKDIIYDEKIAFLFMKNYLQCFYEQTLWKEILILLEEINKTDYTSDLVWQEWICAIKHALDNTYELDVYFDPFTGVRIN